MIISTCILICTCTVCIDIVGISYLGMLYIYNLPEVKYRYRLFLQAPISHLGKCIESECIGIWYVGNNCPFKKKKNIFSWYLEVFHDLQQMCVNCKCLLCIGVLTGIGLLRRASSSQCGAPQTRLLFPRLPNFQSF